MSIDGLRPTDLIMIAGDLEIHHEWQLLSVQQWDQWLIDSWLPWWDWK